IDWRTARERIDLAAVVTALLGPAPGRRGARGRRLWWCCPFHPDRNPSFCVDPGKGSWRCFGCGENGGEAAVVMRLGNATFPEAMAYLTDGAIVRRPGKHPAADPWIRTVPGSPNCRPALRSPGRAPGCSMARPAPPRPA